MRIGSNVSREQVRREELAQAESLGLSLVEFRRKYAPWRLPDVDPEPRRKKKRNGSAKGCTPPLRERIFDRDDGRCRYCGVLVVRGHNLRRGDQFTIDHVIPRSRGGTNDESNLVTACFACNHRKANKTLAEAGMSLRPLPGAPSAPALVTCATVYIRVYTHSARYRARLLDQVEHGDDVEHAAHDRGRVPNGDADAVAPGAGDEADPSAVEKRDVGHVQDHVAA